jgi:hypothetical protein
MGKYDHLHNDYVTSAVDLLRKKLKDSGDKHLIGLEKECTDTQLSLLIDAYLPLTNLVRG